MFEIKIHNDLFTLKHTVDKEDWAPGVWAGCEGMKLTITKIDLENRIITLELIEEVE